MSHYGVSAIHWNTNLAEIDEVHLHKVVERAGGGALALRHAEPVWCADVVDLIRDGHTVWVMVATGRRGSYRNTDRVGINRKPEGREFLYSYADDGTPTLALLELPRYQLPGDAPGYAARPLIDLPPLAVSPRR
jgi:hypothetical protein